MKKHLLLPLLLSLFSFGSSEFLYAEEKAKVVFLSGKPSHGPMAHEHRAGNLLLAKRLNESNLGVEAVVLPDVGYPEDASVLEDAATIVIFCTGHRGHLLNPHLEAFDAFMKNGTGVVMIHWATEAEIGMPAKKFLEWMGGYCDLNWSVNPHWKPNFSTFPDHPIANGLEPFSVHDEWYYHMRFVGDLEGVTPILSDLPPPETLKRPDGERSGNPDVRKAVAKGESQHVGWAYERPDGKGRGFGFTGAHNHVSWKNDMFRKVVLNAILWTANVEVPENGVASPTPSEEELKQNLDLKPARKPKPKPAAQPKPAARAEPPAKQVKYAAFDARLVDREASRLLFEKQRELQVVKLDSTATLNLLIKTLGQTSDAATREGLLRGIVRGLEGRRSVTKPEGWTAVSAKLQASPISRIREITQQLDQVFGDEAAAALAITKLKDVNVPDEERKTLLRSLVTQQNPQVKELLPLLLDDQPMRIAAIRAFGAINDPRAPGLLLDRYANWDPPAKRAAVETLAMRKSYATALLAALKENRLPKEDIPAHVARPLSSLLGSAFVDVFGDLDEMSKDKVELMAHYTKLLTPGNLAKADASKGRLIFTSSCAACHQLYGEGGVLGPDLTGSNRADLSYILLNMIEPSADIPEAYQLVTLHTKTGQVLGGMVAQEDDQRVVLNLVGQTTTVLKSDIEKREVSPMSMMPEGLLTTLQDEQVVDLVKYLQTTQQVDLPK
ncbi:MAG: ThuA domain-containing protein [Verrucomicrobiales bacterium]|nr:ThuA domain-containing protein [Verrucomicrobiales bacterium]